MSLECSYHEIGNPVSVEIGFGNDVRGLRGLITGGDLEAAADILQDQQENKVFKSALEEVSSDLKGGLEFAAALEKHPDIFPKLYINLVKAGEASGKLDTILLDLASSLEKQREFNSKVKGAMVYPIIVISLMFVVMG